MKAYPLIYSRTKNVDFVPDFLTRPADLDYKTALKYISSAISNLDTLKAIRYSTFCVGDYCICGGISCISKILVEKINATSFAQRIMLESVSEYLYDCKGRSIACFIGFTIPKSEVRSGRIPDINLEDYWTNYLEYLKHQWNAAETKSEQLTLPPIDIREKTYSSLHKPEIEMICNKGIIKEFYNSPQDTLDYFFNEIFKGNKSASFISDVNYQSDFDNTVFCNVHVSQSLYNNLKSSAELSVSDTNTSQRNYNTTSARFSERSKSVSSAQNRYSQRFSGSEFSGFESHIENTDTDFNNSKKKSLSTRGNYSNRFARDNNCNSDDSQITNLNESDIINFFKKNGHEEQPNPNNTQFITISEKRNSEVYYEALKILSEVFKNQYENSLHFVRVLSIYNFIEKQLVRILIKL